VRKGGKREGEREREVRNRESMEIGREYEMGKEIER